MKKFITSILAICLFISLFTGCIFAPQNKQDENTEEDSNNIDFTADVTENSTESLELENENNNVPSHEQPQFIEKKEYYFEAEFAYEEINRAVFDENGIIRKEKGLWGERNEALVDHWLQNGKIEVPRINGEPIDIYDGGVRYYTSTKSTEYTYPKLMFIETIGDKYLVVHAEYLTAEVSEKISVNDTAYEILLQIKPEPYYDRSDYYCRDIQIQNEIVSVVVYGGEQQEWYRMCGFYTNGWWLSIDTNNEEIFKYFSFS